MSRPITPTPVLAGRDALEFERRVAEGLLSPVGPVPTPKLDSAATALKALLGEQSRLLYDPTEG